MVRGLTAIRSGWKPMYALGATLNSSIWGLYFSFTRRYLSVELGGGTYVILLITGLEWLFTLFAVLSGKLAERVGGRYVTLLGVSGALPFIAALNVYDPNLLAVVLSLASFSWAIAWPSILSAVLSDGTPTPGRAYSYFTIGSGLGFSLGSAVMGALYGLAGPEGVFTAIAAMYVVTYSLFFLLYPTNVFKVSEVKGGGTLEVINKLLPVLAAFSLTIFAMELLHSVAPVKLSSEIQKLLNTRSELVEYAVFGVVFGSFTALLSVPARIAAGRLSDRFNPLIILATTSSAYLITYWLFVSTTGLIPVIIWQLPLYPFLDVSINTYIAKYLPKHGMTSGFGTALMFSAFGGLMLLPILANPGISAEFLGVLVTTAVLIAILLIAVKVRYDRRHT